MLALRASSGTSPAIDELLGQVNHAIHEAFLTRARRHAGEISHRDPEAALQWALFATNAAAREAILAGALAHYAIEGGRQALRRRLTRSAMAYLQSA